MRRIFADQWDEGAGEWRAPAGFRDRLERRVLRFFGYPAWSPPTSKHLADWLGDRISVARYAGTALRLLTLSHQDGAFAAEILGLAHTTADDMLRLDALARVRAQIESLQAQLEAAVEPARRSALDEALREQYETEALLAADQPYAAEVLSPAAADPLPSSPSPILMLGLALVIGLILGTFVVFLRDALRRNVA